MFNSIIVADDSATARMIIVRCLKIVGCGSAKFVEAKDGAQALEIAKTNGADLLVTDLNMPTLDGRSLLTQIKANPQLAHIPVLVISSAFNDAKEAELIALGAFAVLGKPVTVANLAKIIRRLSPQEVMPDERK